MNKTLPLLILFIVAFSGGLDAQVNRLEINGSATAAKGAILDLSTNDSADKGFLIPRMTGAERAALTPVEGLQVYQTDGAKGFYFYNGSSWRPWRKPISGQVDMTSGSIIVRGEGFTVVNEDIGRDLVTFDTPYSTFPMIILSGQTVEGLPPAIPGDLCAQNMANCNVTHIRYLNMDNPIGAPWEFESGNTLCSPQPGNITTYKTVDWTGSNVVAAGSTFRVNWNVFNGNNRSGLYVDWDQTGTFDGPGELILEESSAITLARNENITVPATACNGLTTVRLVVIDAADQLFSCEIPNGTEGETEQIEIEIVGATNCTYPERQTTCNVAGLTTSDFRVECSDLNGKSADAFYSFKIIDNQ